MEGVIVAAGPTVTGDAFDGEGPQLIDIAPTLLAAVDAPASVAHTGRVLRQVVGAEAMVRAGEAAAPDQAAPEDAVTETEAGEMEEHLRGLGYLE